ncbi:MAG: response regulator, partial [Pseudomonadota bacterium]
MSLSDRVAPHIPYLRRYARALSGSQKSGDNYAAVVLEALIDDPNILGEEGNDKRKLYALLTRLWTSVDTSSSATTVSAEWERNLQAVAPIPRQALLLTTVE